MNPISLIIFLIIGAIAGWLAGQIMKGKGFGLLGNIIVGVIGAFLGSLILGLVGFASTHLIGQIISATVGAVVLLYLVRFLK